VPRTWLHLGLGAFHRAHQAVFLQRLHAQGDEAWLLAGGNLRGDLEPAIAQLRSRGGAYTLETAGPDGQRQYERIRSIREVVAWDASLAGLRRIGASAETALISFTVTEGGYALDAAGALAEDSLPVQEALAAFRAGQPGSTWHGALACLLRDRMRAGAGAVTLLSCDNLRHNGDRSRAALLRFLDLAGDTQLRDWVEANTRSPNCMVDRITPRATAEVARRVKAATGEDDPCALMAESFIQWVVEDDFIAGRPTWERVGAELVRDVQPYEEAKIRLLNATHSCIAWAGALAGHSFIHEGARDPAVRAFAHRYATEGAMPLLEPSPLDVGLYRDTVLQRFGNAAILDTIQRVASDSFAKVPAFVAPSVRESLARGRPLDALALPAALLAAFLCRWASGRLRFEHQDSAMRPEEGRAVASAAQPARALAASETLWGSAAREPAWAEAVQRAFDGLPAALR
jgi:D-arabinitol 4-dehydrogenase